MRTKEILLSIAVVVLLFLYLDKDVEVVEKTITQTDTIYVKQKPINLTYNSQPIKIEPIINHISDIEQVYIYPKSAKRYTYKDSVPNGEIVTEIVADTIYDRRLTYSITPTIKEVYVKETITKFDNRLMLGAYINFANTRNLGAFNPNAYTWNDGGIELLYVRNKAYYGVNVGLTQNRFDYEWARNGVIDGVIGFKFGIKIK